MPNEFWINLALQALSAGVFIGGLTMSIKSQEERMALLKEQFKEHFERLEAKQDKHNCLIERMALVEYKIKDLRGR